MARNVSKEQTMQVVEKYMSEFIGRDFANRTLARKIVLENPHLFTNNQKDIEVVRSMIRYRRNAVGDSYRDRYEHAHLYERTEQKPSEYMAQFLTKAEEPKERDWYLPQQHKKILVLSDLHIPYHNTDAILTALDYGFEAGIDGIYLNGDVIDFARISRWQKDPAVPSAQVEIDAVYEFLYGLKGFDMPIYYKMGNHEDRWNAYLIQNAPELHSLDAMQMESILKLDELDIELIDSKTKAHFGKLLVIHGHEFGESFFSPVNPARGLFLKAKTSVLAGHNHQTSTHHENDLNGNPTATFSVGCLCDLSPDYRPYAFTKWNVGFAIVDIEEDGYFTVHNKRIMNGRVR
jgi:predicted phosphodiesterase